jgi:1-deoxy-D-xylulose-5-phosphate synthase
MLDEIPERAFDVGIAEQHAVTLAAGMATQGLIPYCTIYSTFLQRAYDQIIHDVALQNLPVVFCIDRAGLVGEDGATHHGVFDLAYLRCIPNMVIFAPLNEIELRNIMYTAQLGIHFPLAIRYPRGRGTLVNWKLPMHTIEIGKGKCVFEGLEIAILSIGTIGNSILEIEKELPSNKFSLYNMRFVKPLDEDLLHKIFKKYNTIITIEDGTITSGFGSAILEFASKKGYNNTKIKQLGIPDTFIEHGNNYELFNSINLSNEKILKLLLNL